MTSAPFLPIAALSPTGAESVPPGSLAYLERGKAFALFARSDQQLMMLDLGGESPFGVWRVTDDFGTALVVADWRIEVDPTSAVNVKHERLLAGQAFTAGADIGIVGYEGQGYRLPVAIASAGHLNTTSSNAHRGAFTRWRIVTGPAERPVTLVDSDQLAPAKGE